MKEKQWFAHCYWEEVVMTAIEKYEKWFTSQPDWIQMVLTLEGQQKDNYLYQLFHNGEAQVELRELSCEAQVKLRDAEIQRTKFLENPAIRRYVVRKNKWQKKVVRRVVRPPLSKVEQIFAAELGESFRRLDYACQWGWNGRDIHTDPKALSIEQVASRVGCQSQQLKKRLAHFGYAEDRLFMDGYYHLEKLEADEKRQAAQRRQAEHRANLSSEDKARIQEADRKRKRLKQAQEPQKYIVLEPQKKCDGKLCN
jgi:hypothetical protein